MCHDNEEWCKIWRASNLSLQNWHGQFDQFWPEHLKVSNTFVLMRSFWAKYVLFKIKKYRRVIFHDAEEWYKIWWGINLLFQNWHEEFGKYWPEHSRVPKMLTLMGSFWTKYTLFELKKYTGVIFHGNEEWCKILRKTDLWFEKWHEKFGKFSPEHLKVLKLGPWWDPLVQRRKFISLKCTEELYVMTMKNDAKFEEELTCHFKTDMRNLKNFDSNTWKQKKKCS